MILDPKTGKPARIGYKVDEKGMKIRISRISGEEVKAVKPKIEKKKKTTPRSDLGQAPGTEVSKAKDTQETNAKKETTAVPAKKSPFWKRMGFGAEAQAGEVKEESHSQQDHTIPSQQLHSRSAGRGS